jgi:predicted nucleic acid-binding Zn ribbon protein
MGSARSSFPVRVGTMLTAALPALEERLLAERIRQGWRTAVGSELAHRTRPGELRAGTLTVMADNSPWLQELSMRSAEVLDAVRARFGPTVTALRPSLAGPAPP